MQLSIWLIADAMLALLMEGESVMSVFIISIPEVRSSVVSFRISELKLETVNRVELTTTSW